MCSDSRARDGSYVAVKSNMLHVSFRTKPQMPGTIRGTLKKFIIDQGHGGMLIVNACQNK